MVSSVGAGGSGKEKLELVYNVGDSFAHGVSSYDSSMKNAGYKPTFELSGQGYLAQVWESFKWKISVLELPSSQSGGEASLEVALTQF